MYMNCMSVRKPLALIHVTRCTFHIMITVTSDVDTRKAEDFGGKSIGYYYVGLFNLRSFKFPYDPQSGGSAHINYFYSTNIFAPTPVPYFRDYCLPTPITLPDVLSMATPYLSFTLGHIFLGTPTRNSTEYQLLLNTHLTRARTPHLLDSDPLDSPSAPSVPYYIPDTETSPSACNIRLPNGSAPSHLCPYIPDAETSPSACNIRLSNGSAPSHLCPLLYTRRWNKPLCL